MIRWGKALFGVVCLICGSFWPVPLEAALKVFVSIAPQRYFVQKIGGPLVDVSILVPAGADPHTYEPKPRQMAALAGSVLYFAQGVDFERVWLPRIAGANPKLKIIPTDAGIEKIVMADHDHGPAASQRRNRPGDRHGGAPDPHLWLSPLLVKRQAERITQALGAADPANRHRYEAGYAAFAAEIVALDGELRALLAGRKGEPFLVLHPSWGYFAQAYGLVQVPIASEGKDPKPAQLQRLIDQARRGGIRRVFVQPQFPAKSAAMVAREIGGTVIFIDPLAEDWAANLRDAARKFAGRER